MATAMDAKRDARGPGEVLHVLLAGQEAPVCIAVPLPILVPFEDLHLGHGLLVEDPGTEGLTSLASWHMQSPQLGTGGVDWVEGVGQAEAPRSPKLRSSGPKHSAAVCPARSAQISLGSGWRTLGTQEPWVRML